MAEIKSTKKSSGGFSSPLDMDQVFESRVVIKGEIYDSVESAMTDEWGNEIYVGPDLMKSSYPHLTHKSDARAAHVTSSRVVFNPPEGQHVVHQRFHQDKDGKTEPTHDRYFAVDRTTGVVHAVKVEFKPEVHLGKNDTVPMRGATLAQTSKVVAKLQFTVGEPDAKHPPLSPRSSKRELPDSGYAESKT